MRLYLFFGFTHYKYVARYCLFYKLNSEGAGTLVYEYIHRSLTVDPVGAKFVFFKLNREMERIDADCYQVQMDVLKWIYS